MTSIFEQVKASLASRLPEVLADLLPGGRVSGREYVCASLQGGVGMSCATNLETGKGSDFATGESWGDVIALAAKVWNMRQGEAAQELARLYRIDVGQNAPQPPCCHAQHGLASALWRYTDGQGCTLSYVARFDTPAGKVILPLCFAQYGTNRPQWVWKALPEPRPLYNLPGLTALPDDARFCWWRVRRQRTPRRCSFLTAPCSPGAAEPMPWAKRTGRR